MALTDSQKSEIKKDFSEWTGGFSPAEVDEEQIEEYVEDYSTTYGEADLRAFLGEWAKEPPPDPAVVKAQFEAHTWTFKELAKWSGEPDIMTCERCGQDLQVPRDGSAEQAAKEQQIEGCDEHLMKSVMAT